MASERDNMNNELARRRQRRMEHRQQLEREQRALKMRLVMVGVILILVAVLIVAVNRDPANHPSEPVQTIQTTVPQTTAAPTEPEPQTTAPQETEHTGETSESQTPESTEAAQTPSTSTIHITALGDLNITDQMVEQAVTAGGYDFSTAFVDVAPLLNRSDLTILNFEGILSGAPYGNQMSSAPLELARYLKDVGVDVVQTANSASVRNGLLGLKSTLDGFTSVGITPVGTFYDSDHFRRSGGFTIMEVGGLRVALVAFTKGMDNLGLPEGSEDCVNLLYTDYATDYKDVDEAGINRVLRSIREEEPDLTIALLHWGSENNESVSQTQEDIRDLMLAGGVDVIFGTHSHLVQTIEFDRENNTLVAFSLGDFYGDAQRAGTNYSMILDLEVCRDNVTGEVTLVDYTYTPIYTVRPEQSAAGGLRVVRINEALARYASDYIGKITSDTASGMEYALTRLEQRINTPLDD